MSEHATKEDIAAIMKRFDKFEDRLIDRLDSMDMRLRAAEGDIVRLKAGGHLVPCAELEQLKVQVQSLTRWQWMIAGGLAVFVFLKDVLFGRIF